MVTIKDVAREAGVSVCTVSYALNNIAKVNPATKERIMAIARELDYHPNSSARNLKLKTTNRIGFFHTELFSPFIGPVLQAIQFSLLSTDIDMIAMVVTRDNGQRALGLLREKFLSSAIIFNHCGFDPNQLQTIANELPLVIVSQDPDTVIRHRNISTVLVDDLQAVRECTARLARSGRRRFAFLSGPQNDPENIQRFKGFREALAHNGLPFTPRDCIVAHYSRSQAKEKLHAYLQAGHRPDAVVSANDDMALAALEVFAEAGLRVPEDVAVWGFDNIAECLLASPVLSSIATNRYLIGDQASSLLFDLLAGKGEGQTFTITPELLVRESSGLTGDRPVSD